VILRRWQQYTGTPAILDGLGGNYDEVAKERTSNEPDSDQLAA
jgi:hypothetical protein